MIVATGVMIGIILFAAAPYMIRLMGAEGDFAHLAVQYMQVYAICSPVTTIIFAVDNYLRICGFIRGSMVINILMSALSGFLEFLFLGVFHWNVWAAALATCTGMFYLYHHSIHSFHKKTRSAQILQTAFYIKYDKTDTDVRKSQLPQQYCRQDNLRTDEFHPHTHRR